MINSLISQYSFKYICSSILYIALKIIHLLSLLIYTYSSYHTSQHIISHVNTCVYLLGSG